MLDILRVIIRPNLGLIATPKNGFVTGFPATQEFLRALLYLVISEPSTQSLVTESP
jgi:hypothetical protein